jgi:hypothetical protein
VTGGAVNYPDGLTEAAIDALIAEVDAVLAASPVSSCALLAGAAAERRRRRLCRQAVVPLVRALPVAWPVSGPDGEAA